MGNCTVKQIERGEIVYNQQTVADRIKLTAEQRKVSVRNLLDACDLVKNTINKLSSGSDISLVACFKISEFLDVSIDYLVGRTDIPEVNR